MDTKEQILNRDWSIDFIEGMKNRIVMSHHKYGWMSETYPNHLADAIGSLEMRLAAYKKTGNTEFLMDIANFAMIEYMFPQHDNAHFDPLSGDTSPGLDGISAKELMESESRYR